MKSPTTMRLVALVLCGMLAMVLAPACDLSYDCETVEAQALEYPLAQ